jgi:hypothetical protein
VGTPEWHDDVDEEVVRALIIALYTSGKWWVVPFVSKRAMDMADEVLRAFYWNQHDDGYHICTGNLAGVQGIAFFDKRYLSGESFQEFMVSLGAYSMSDERHFDEQDMLVLTENEQPHTVAVATARLNSFAGWVNGDYSLAEWGMQQ